jgi:tRNA threonylcarbamoyladenosine dehydratase
VVYLFAFTSSAADHHQNHFSSTLLSKSYPSSLVMSFLERIDSPTARLALVALAASSLTAFTIFSFQSLRRKQALESLRKEASTIPPSEIHRLNSIGGEDVRQLSFKEVQIAHRAKRGEYDEELILEQLARNRAFFGDDGISKIRAGFVIVVGAGGVGSWCATMLARSGIGTLRINVCTYGLWG